MKAKIKKLLLLLLICVLVTGLLPASALAAKDAAATNSVTVYFTVEGTGNNRTGFVEAGGYSMALQKLTVPYFDLALYGLEEIYYNPDCYAGAGASSQVAGTKETAEGNVTILHLFIYATEVFRLDVDPKDAGQGYLAEAGWPYFNFHQVVPGSTFVNFWEYGYNINYYLNYMYPLAKPGWGSTCDQILLKDGDVVTVRFENNNGNCGTFHHFGETGLVTKEISKGNQLNMTLYQTTKTADYSGTGHEPVGAGYTVKVVSEIGDEVLAETKTNEYGDFRLDTSKLPKGRYYVVSETFGPAVMQLLIGEHDYIASVTAPTCTKPGYTTYTCACGSSYTADATDATGHTEKDGVCTVCGQKTAVAMYGDVNGDNNVTAMDVSLVAQAAAGKAVTLDETAADVNGDNVITAMDVSLIAQYAAGKIDHFPVEG